MVTMLSEFLRVTSWRSTVCDRRFAVWLLIYSLKFSDVVNRQLISGLVMTCVSILRLHTNVEWKKKWRALQTVRKRVCTFRTHQNDLTDCQCTRHGRRHGFESGGPIILLAEEAESFIYLLWKSYKCTHEKIKNKKTSYMTHYFLASGGQKVFR